MSIEELQRELDVFARERDWQQFHTIRNLIFALVGEVGELAESVQWIGEIDLEYFEKNVEVRQKVIEEIADIFIYLLRLSDVMGIRLLDEAREKMRKNELRYTKSSSKGNSRKH